MYVFGWAFMCVLVWTFMCVRVGIHVCVLGWGLMYVC